MTTERDALELLADLRAHLEAFPNDSRARDEIRRLVLQMDGEGEVHPIQFSS